MKESDMKIRSSVVSLAALAFGLAAAAPAFAQAVTHHNAQKTGSVMTMQKIEQRQRGYSTEGLYNYVPPQSVVQPCIHVQTYCL
jgi:hypothetical protein